jgi:hypothetical protein
MQAHLLRETTPVVARNKSCVLSDETEEEVREHLQEALGQETYRIDLSQQV